MKSLSRSAENAVSSWATVFRLSPTIFLYIISLIFYLPRVLTFIELSQTSPARNLSGLILRKNFEKFSEKGQFKRKLITDGVLPGEPRVWER